MKIGILIDRLNVGGVEKIAIEQVKALRLINEDSYLVVLSRKAVVEGAFKDLLKDIPIIYLDDRLPNFLRFTFKIPVFSFFSFFHLSYPFLIPWVIKKNEFDYFISHGTYTSFSAVTIRKFKKIRYSAFIWDPISYILVRVYLKKFPSVLFNLLLLSAKFLDRIIVDNSDVILVGGDAHNNFIRKLNPKLKIETISPSIHPLSKLNRKKKDFILIVTAWKQGKSPEYTFELIKQVPNIKIKMAGKWLNQKYKEEFMNKIIKNKASKNIEIIGEVDEKELSKLYREANLILQINDDRGFGLPALEAAGHGTTFIIPEGQGVCNIFRNKIDGFFIKEKDIEKIVEYLKILQEDRKLSQKMGESAWLLVKKHHNWGKHAQKLVKIARNYYYNDKAN